MQLPQSYYSSKLLLSGLLVVALLPTAGCIGVLCLLLRRGTEVFQEAMGWAFVTVFSLLLVGLLLLALKLLRQLVSKAPRLTLTGSGITYQEYEVTLGEIPWADVKDAYLRHAG